MSVRILQQVIETTLTVRGDGSDQNPLRTIRQYWTMDGELLAEVDPVNPSKTFASRQLMKGDQ